MKRILVSCVIFQLVITGCNTGADVDTTTAYASRYKPLASGATLLQGATVLTGTGERLDNTDLYVVRHEYESARDYFPTITIKDGGVVDLGVVKVDPKLFKN